MKLNLRHDFACDAGTLWRLTDSDTFETRLAEASNTDRELVESREENGVQYRRRRISVRRELPGPMRKVLGSDTIRYDQETWRKEGENTLRWKIIPMVLEGRFHGEGVTRIEPLPGGGCARIIEGDLTIRVPLIGGKMEQKLADDVAQSYGRAAEILRDMLAAEG